MLNETLQQTGLPTLIGWQDDDNEENVFQRALTASLYPFRLLFTPTAIKAYLTTFLFLTTSTILLSISTGAYAVFYYTYIPQSSLTVPIYLQYTADTFPHATIPLAPVLISQQPYDISLILHMPRDPINLSAGNFMLDLTLHGKLHELETQVLKTLPLDVPIPSSALHHSRRPAIMPYASRTTNLVTKLVKMPLHVVGIGDVDATELVVSMFEGVEFNRGRDNIPTVAELEIQSAKGTQVHVYSASLVFDVRFHGLRWLVAKHRVLSFLVFTALFYGVSISTLAVGWALIAVLVNGREEGKIEDRMKSKEIEAKEEKVKVKQEIEPVVKIEEERIDLRGNWDHEGSGDGSPEVERVDEVADDEESDEDEMQQYERLRKKMDAEARRRQMAHDSGIGTSMESDNVRLLRRSSQKGQRP